MPWLVFHCGFNTVRFSVNSLLIELWPPTVFVKQNSNLYCKDPPPKRTWPKMLFSSSVDAGHLSPLFTSRTMSRVTPGLESCSSASSAPLVLVTETPLTAVFSRFPSPSPCPSPPVVSLFPDNDTWGLVKYLFDFWGFVFCLLMI